jgi:hypothetical protein
MWRHMCNKWWLVPTLNGSLLPHSVKSDSDLGVAQKETGEWKPEHFATEGLLASVGPLRARKLVGCMWMRNRAPVSAGNRTKTLKNGVFWDVTPCGSCKNRRFGGT